MPHKRSFSRKQRYQLLAISGWVCEICGVKLTKDNFHADHIKPHSMGGETSLRNGQALCMSCNLKKGDKYMANEEYNYVTPKSIAFRNWQQRAHEIVMPIWRDSDTNLCLVKPNVLVEVCAGGGKTLFTVGCFLTLKEQLKTEYAVVIVPNLTIKYEWIKELNEHGIPTHDDVTNDMLRARSKSPQRDILEGKCCVLTYQQLSVEPELIARVFENHKVLLVADEVHHADEAKEFGPALMAIAPLAAFKLALSATPFNSSGGALAMCDFVESLDAFNNKCRTAVPAFRYSYGDAVRDGVCRRLQFITVKGKVKNTLIDEVTGKEYITGIDLDVPNSCETFKSLLRADGPFFEEMAINALNAFTDLKRTDPRAGMLVIGYSLIHGGEIAVTMKRLCRNNPAWSSYKFKEIYHDSIDAGRQIADLKTDDTDIVITVKMISEGVNVKRLKVELYATDYKTSSFFSQAAGRIVRMEDHLPASQYAVMIIPAHRTLEQYAYEIERACKPMPIKPEGPKPPPPPPPEPKKVKTLIDSKMTVGPSALILQGKKETEREYAALFFKLRPDLIGVWPESQAADMWRTIQQYHGEQCSSEQEATPSTSSSVITLTRTADYEADLKERKRLRTLNDNKVTGIVKYVMENNPNSQSEMSYYYARINCEANKMVNITNKDDMTSTQKLQARFEWLVELEVSLRSGNLSVHRYEERKKS